MNLEKFQKNLIKKDLEINDSWGRVFSFIDFGNVTYWFREDTRDVNGNTLKLGNKIWIDIQKLYDFSCVFSESIRFYYGFDSSNKGSVGFIFVSKKIFGAHKVSTKEIQQIKHYIKDSDLIKNSKFVNSDRGGDFIYIPKCNFDVEISVDAIRLIDAYDTFCLFSGDADFIKLIKFLKEKNKKIILIKSGHIRHELHNLADLVVNAQNIKKYICRITQKSSQS
ncbi:MAG: NYN domain-containing protein [Candidatus Paceibacterota bacterium]